MCSAARIMGSFLQNEFVMLTLLDAFPWGTDGVIEANPGGHIDLTRNYYRSALVPPNGHELAGALNVDLEPTLKLWKGHPDSQKFHDHIEVHDWFLWTHDQMCDQGGPLTPYEDPYIKKQRDQFIMEMKGQRPEPVTRRALYGGIVNAKLNTAYGPVVENFGGKITLGLFWNAAYSRKMNPMPIQEKPGWKFMHVINNGEMNLMEPSATWRAANMMCKEVFDGDFTAEFSFRLTPCRTKEKSMEPSDGLALWILPGLARAATMGGINGNCGLNGPKGGVGVVLDAHRHEKYGDPEDHDRRVSLRSYDSPNWIKFSDTVLPRSFAEGDQWWARIGTTSVPGKPKKVFLSCMLYSEKDDEKHFFQQELPREAIPEKKNLAITSGSEGGGMWVTIDNLIIVPAGK